MPARAAATAGGSGFAIFSGERAAAAARARSVRVLDLEPAAKRIVDIVDHRAGHVAKAQRIDEDLDPKMLEGVVTLLGVLVVDGHAVLEAGASAAGNPDAQSRVRLALLDKQRLDLFGSLLCKGDLGGQCFFVNSHRWFYYIQRAARRERAILFRSVFERFLVGPHLEFGGVKLEEIVDTVGTPVYILDAAVIRARCQAFRKAAPDAHLAYASKANSTLAVLDIVRQEGFDVDAASMGEMEAALRAGFKGPQITLHGNAKNDAELDSAAKLPVRRVVIDNAEEIDRLALFSEAIKKKTSVLVRVAPGVDPKTHMAISTGQEDTKFGFSLTSGAALEAVKAIKKHKSLKFCGLHFHIGSQLMNSMDHVAAVKRVASFAEEMGKIEDLVVGGGLGVRYTPEDEPQAIQHFVDSIMHAAEIGFKGKPPKIGFEPGRAIVGEAGTTIYRVMVRKQVGRKTYLTVDGGLADNPRPQLYEAQYMAFNATRPSEDHFKEFKLVGHHCETDTLIESAMLPKATEVGDLIAVPSTGAYGAAMASNYNRYPRPATVVVENRKAFIAVHRETIDQMFVNERLR